MRKLLLLAALALFASSPALAADQVQALPSDNAVMLTPTQSNDAPACSATQPTDAGVAPLLFEAPAAEPESCYPAECGTGANPKQCGLSCCRYKCCIC